MCRIKTPRRCTAQAAAHEQEQATDLTGSSQVDMTDHSHAITDSSLATPMTDSIPTVPMTESSHSDIAVTVLAVDANHSDMAAEVTEGVKAAKEEVPESVNSASGVQNSVEPMVTSDIGTVGHNSAVAEFCNFKHMLIQLIVKFVDLFIAFFINLGDKTSHLLLILLQPSFNIS